MKLTAQKTISAKLLNCSKKRVIFDIERLDEIKEAITKADLRSLIKDKAITAKPVQGISRFRAKKRQIQKNKGKQKGQGSRKGKKTARLPKKKIWMNKIRLQRKFLKEIKDKKVIEGKTYRDLRSKSKGGFFRSKRHIKIFLDKILGKNE
ncbi:50S ribosomal protein L19e [Candidatus Woesearchaeota archaeon]|nr:50S ribosomal protein L19e [Candidatus Woesearchaeota archaeon]MBL7050592.1 50S ribosomal protein L19e [Candidatus Woesearchaeota archaeon]